MPHSAKTPVPVFKQLPHLEDLSDVEERSDSNDADFDIHQDPVRRGFDQHELNHFARNLGLSKKASEILSSRLNEKNLLEQGVQVSYFRTRESTFLQYFRSDSGFVFCHNIPGLLKELGLSIYSPNEWRMFIDSSKQSLKCVLLHSASLFGVVAIGHSVCLHEEYGDVKRVIELLQYEKHSWIIFVDLKMVPFLLGQQRGYIKYPCFLCMWDCRARKKHWVGKNWPPRSDLKPGDPNTVHESLVDRKKIIFPPLHIKLGLMKQFVKAFSTDGDCLKYIILTFPIMSIEKFKAGVFNGLQI